MIFNTILVFTIIIIYILTHLGNNKKNVKDNLFLLVVFTLFFILVGTREMTRGNDTMTYLRLFNALSINRWNSVIFGNYYEPGYIIFNILLSYISKSSNFFMLIMSFLFNYAIFRFIKNNSNNYLMSTLMYVELLFFYYSMTMMRQFLALVIVLYSFKYVKNKKIIPFLLFIFLATTVHTSAFVSVLIYPMYYSKYSNRKAIIIFVISIILLLFLGNFYSYITPILNRKTYYLNRIGEIKVINVITSLIYLIMFLFSSIILKNKEKNLNSNCFYLFAFLLSFCMLMISVKMAIMERISIYFTIFTIVALPNIIGKKVKNYVIVNSIIFILIFIYSSTIMVYRPEWNTSFEYKSCILPDNNYICDYN